MKKIFLVTLLSLLIAFPAFSDDTGRRKSSVKTARTAKTSSAKSRGAAGVASWDKLIRVLPEVEESVSLDDVKLGMVNAVKTADNIAYKLAHTKCPGSSYVDAIDCLGGKFNDYVSSRYGAAIGHLSSEAPNLKCRYQYFQELYFLDVIAKTVFGEARSTLPDYAWHLINLQNVFAELVIDWTTLMSGPSTSHVHDDPMAVLAIIKGANRMLKSDYYTIKDPDLGGYYGDSEKMMKNLLSKFDYNRLDTSNPLYLTRREFKQRVDNFKAAWNSYMSARQAWISTLPLETTQIALRSGEALMLLEWTEKLKL